MYLGVTFRHKYQQRRSGLLADSKDKTKDIEL